jgi:hypothetical protein
MSRSSPLLDLAVLYTTEAYPALTDSGRFEVRSLIGKYLDGVIPHSALASIFQMKFGTADPVDRLKEILEVSDHPLPDHRSFPENHHRKRHHWSAAEDTRLIAGMHKFGMDNWGIVAQYVGNNRTRSECSQRWQRGLDPRISRSQWTPEDDGKLCKLVGELGKKSWVRVSAAMGNRSDVQCRYRYQQMLKGCPDSPIEEKPIEATTLETEIRGNEPKEDNLDVTELDRRKYSTSEISWMLHP